MTGRDGRLSHGEMETGSGVIMLATPTPEYRAPKRHRAECEQAARWSEVPHIIDGVLVYVDDIDSHYERARVGGATILSELEDGPDGKRYRAEDVEGHRWMFIHRA
jgi:PhnB protein